MRGHYHQRLRHFTAGSFCCLALMMVCSGHGEILGPPVVQVADSVLVGTRDPDGTEAFLGIPYAQPPVGDARWQAPTPWPFAAERRDASRFAPACMQSGSGLAWYHGMMTRVGVDPALMTGPDYSEDCLYLNVWSDPGIPGPKPVLVFIHGGSNTGGWSYEPNYHGGPLARQGLVVVTVAYRLGVFGWLSHPEMDIENPALHDLALGLDWVHDHIARFGGDPGRIIVSGESSGAANALHLALSPLSRGRIAGVIHQSGGWPADGVPTPQVAKSRGLALQRDLVGEEGSLDALRRLPAVQIMKASRDIYADFQFDAIQDPVSLPSTVQDLIERDVFPPLDIILGSNLNESLMYIAPGDTPEAYLAGRVSPGSVADVLGSYAEDTPREAILDQLGTGLDFLCPTLKIASAVAHGGGRAWVYRFDRVRPGFAAIGAYHGAELPYVFDTHDPWLPTEAEDRELTATLLGYWQRFAEQGDPNGAGAPAWPAWQPGGQQAVILSADTSAVPHPDVAFCDALYGD